MKKIDLGEKMYRLAEELYPICRSITGDGVRSSLGLISKIIPNLTIINTTISPDIVEFILKIQRGPTFTLER